MNYGNKIQKLRKNLGLSQEQLAEKVGVARQTISKWELEETSPDLKQAQTLAQIFNININELVNLEKKEGLKEIKSSHMNKNNKVIINYILNPFIIFILSLFIVTLFVLSLSCLVISISLIANINYANLIPFIPYLCKIFISITIFALGILSSLLIVKLITIIKKILNKQVDLLKDKQVNKLLIKILILFIIFLILSIIICIYKAQTISFWHKWNWFLN